jgi:hypothetical protein
MSSQNNSHWKRIENPLFANGPTDTFAKLHFDYTNQDPPLELFHYTSEDALIKIVNSGFLWATDCQYLNDQAELIDGLNIFKNVLVEFDSNEFIDVTNRVFDEWSSRDWTYFIISFSENPDVLSQWRAYSEGATGCAIGFDAIKLKHRAGFGEFVNINIDPLSKQYCYYFHLLKVVYNINAKRKIAKSFLSEAYTSYKKAEAQGLSALEVKNYINSIAYRLGEFIVSFKNSQFSEELEWRIVVSKHNSNAGKSINFRPTQFGISPYVKVNISPVEMVHENCLPIKRIILAPKSKSKNNIKGMRMMLNNFKYSAIIDESSTTLR